MQKFRLYLKRLSGIAQHQGGGPNSFCGSIEQTPKLGPYGRFEIQALAASGQIPPQTLAALHAELLGRPTANANLPLIDHQPMLQPSYGQPLPSNITKQIPQPVVEDVHSGFGSWHSNNMVGSYGQLGGQNGQNMLMGMLQSQSQSQHVQKQSITVQPSRLVVPAQSSVHFQTGNNAILTNQAASFNRSSVIDYNHVLPQSVVGQRPERDNKKTVCQVDNENRVCGQTVGEKQISFGEPVQGLDQGPLRNLGFVGKGTSIPSRFAVYEDESPTSNFNHGDNNVPRRVKQEPNNEFLENSKAGGIPIRHHVSKNDLMSVFSE